MRRFFALLSLVVLVAIVVWLFPLLRSVWRFGTLPKSLDKPFTVLVLGVAPEYKYYHQKALENFRGLSDVNLLVRFDPGRNRVVVLSIPRDVRVNIPGYGWYLINQANHFGGPELAKDVVSRFTGVPIDAYVAVSTEAIRKGIDELGGVEVCVERAMKYRDDAAKLDIDLKPGCQRLNGAQAEGFLRFRKDALGDIGRIQRQQAFFQALKQQALTPAGVWRLPRVFSAVEKNIRTDLSRQQIASLMGFAARRPELVSLLTPGEFGAGWVVDKAGLEALVNQYFRPGVGASRTAADLRGSLAVVIYAAPEEKEAQAMRERLKKLGLQVLLREVESAPAETEVITNTEAGLAETLGKALKLPWRVSGETALGFDLSVRLASGFRNP